MKTCREWTEVTPELFHAEIRPANRPAVLRGLVVDWPLVAAGRDTPAALCAYLRRFGTDRPAMAFFGPPEIRGRFFYNETLDGFNHERRQVPLADILDLLMRHLDDPDPPSFYAGGVPVDTHLPGLLEENPAPPVAPDGERLVAFWVGNRARIPAHWDLPQNIACDIAGRRRFTLLPTGQVQNLYVGPLDFTLAGQPCSLVDFDDPDFARFPRFRDALAHCEEAILEPGDALYIPSLWWHRVESLDAAGAMMNFWWREGPSHLVTPFLTMLHALLTIRDLPPGERRAWKTMFDHYIFQTNGDPWAHLPPHARGIFGPLTPDRLQELREYLIGTLRR